MFYGISWSLKSAYPQRFDLIATIVATEDQDPGNECDVIDAFMYFMNWEPLTENNIYIFVLFFYYRFFSFLDW